MHIFQKRKNGMQTKNQFQFTKETKIFISSVAPLAYYHAFLQSNVDQCSITHFMKDNMLIHLVFMFLNTLFPFSMSLSHNL